MKKITEFLTKYNSYALFCHMEPDGDALGSIYALKLGLQQLGKKCYLFCESEIPSKLRYLNTVLDKDENILSTCDAFVLMDCNNPHRTGGYERVFEGAKQKIAIIDHHQKEHFKASCKYIDPKSPSTCDMAFEILKELDVKFTKQICDCLYAGISSDTGCFVHPSTSIITHEHVAQLMRYGADIVTANYNLFKHKPNGYIEFLKYYLSKTRSFLGGQLFVTIVDSKHYNRYKSEFDNSAFDFMQGVEGNEIQVRITEKQKGNYNISFRSNKYVNVNEIAKEFNGGGHKRASGGSSKSKPNMILKKLLPLCLEHLEHDK